MAEYLYTHVVTFEETNLVGNVYFANYVRWQGHCRERFLLEHTPTIISELYSGRLALVTVSVHLDFISECFAGEVIDIFMARGASIASAGRVEMKFRYERQGKLLAKGSQTVACMRRIEGTSEMQITAIPAQLDTALNRF